MDKDIFNQRLLIFADHLRTVRYHGSHELIDEVELIALEANFRVPYKMRYRYWVFDEFPNVSGFDEWYYDEMTGAALYEGCDAQEGTVAAVIDYFQLSLDEFGHLFDIDGFQLCDQFGGERLSPESTLDGNAIAKNIIELVKAKRATEV